MAQTLDRSNSDVSRAGCGAARLRLSRHSLGDGGWEGSHRSKLMSEQQDHIRLTERVSWHNTAQPGVQFRTRPTIGLATAEDKWSGCAARVHVLTSRFRIGITRACRQRQDWPSAMAFRREQESAEVIVPRATSRKTKPDGLTPREGLNLAGRHDHRWSCSGGDEADWPSHR